MAEAATFDQAIEVLGEIRGVIAGALQSLGHQQDLETGCVPLRNGLSQMFLEQGVANAVDILIHLENFAGAVEVKGLETGVNEIQHLAQDCGHLDELANVRG